MRFWDGKHESGLSHVNEVIWLPGIYVSLPVCHGLVSFADLVSDHLFFVQAFLPA